MIERFGPYVDGRLCRRSFAVRLSVINDGQSATHVSPMRCRVMIDEQAPTLFDVIGVEEIDLVPAGIEVPRPITALIIRYVMQILSKPNE